MDARAGTSVRPISTARQWYLVIVLMVLGLVAAIDRQCLAVLAPMIKADLGLSDAQVSLLIAVSFAIFNTLTAIPVGWLIDRYSRKTVLGLGAFLWAMVTAVSGLAGSFTQLFWGRAGVGFAEGGLGPTAFSMIRDAVAPERRGRAFSVFGLSNSIGNGASIGLVALAVGVVGPGPHLFPVIGELRSWQVVLIGLGLFSLPFCLLTLPIVEPPRVASREPFLAGYAAAVRFMARERSLFIPIILFMASISALGGSMIGWGPSVAVRIFDMAPQEVGKFLGLVAIVCMPIGLLVSGFIIDALRARGSRTAAARVALGGLLLTIVPTVSLPLAPSPALFLAANAGSLITLGSLYQIANKLLAMAAPRESAGRVVAVYTLCFTGIAALGPLVVGLLSDHAFAAAGQRSLAYALATGSAVFLTIALISTLWIIRSFNRAASRIN
jgi:MFS family permease